MRTVRRMRLISRCEAVLHYHQPYALPHTDYSADPCVAVYSPPLAAGIPFLFKTSAIWRSVPAPLAFAASITGRTSAARFAALPVLTFWLAQLPLCACAAMIPALSPPNVTPRALAAANAALVRAEIILTFMLGCSGQNVNCGPIRLGEVAGGEIHAGLHQAA